jgi:hypothetical protein
MFRRWVTLSAAAAVFSLVGAANSAQAAPKALLGVDANGNTFSSGWTWDVANAAAGTVDLTFIRAGAGGTFFFEKNAVLSLGNIPLVITFAPIPGETQHQLVIADESVRNNTGQDWTGMIMSLSAASGTFGFGTSDGSSGVGGFRIDPFTTATFSNGTADLTLGGGTVAAGTTWFPGAGSTVGLTLNVTGTQAFTLTENPIPPGGGPVPIPLPAGVWTGLSGLAGLALIGAAKNARKHMA